MTHFRDIASFTSPGTPHTGKRRALKRLNDDTRNVQTALNQAQSAIAHALRVIEADYQCKRTAIMNSDDIHDIAIE
jgi:hypothetical protein